VAGAPSALVEVAAWPLLVERQIEPVRMTLALPELELTRTVGGELVLAFAGELAALPLATAGGDGLDAILVGDAEGIDAGLARLRQVRVTALALRFFDEAAARLTTAAAPVFELAGGPGAAPGQFLARIDLDRFPAQDLDAIVPMLPLGELELPVSGQIRFAFDPATAASGKGRSTSAPGARPWRCPQSGWGWCRSRAPP
jgi:hypothetical protein